MAWMKDIGERFEGKGWLGVGIGAVVLAPVVLPFAARNLRPLAKGAIKGYLALSDRMREAFAETGEQLQDLVAEARSEYELAGNDGEMMTLSANGEGAEGAAEGERPKSTAHRKPRARSTRSTEKKAA